MKKGLFVTNKKVLLLFIALFLINSCQPERTMNQIRVGFMSEKYNIEKTKGGWSKINMQDFELVSTPGDPMLPFKVFEIAVPPNTDMKKIKLECKATYKSISSKVDIKPAPAYRARVKDEELVYWENKPIINGKNIKIYNENSFYPPHPIRIISKAQMRKWKFLRVAYFPFQYNPVQRKLRYADHVTVYLKYDTSPIDSRLSGDLLKDAEMDEEAKSRFVNFKETSKWYFEHGRKPIPRQSSARGYVIITTKSIVKNLGNTLTDFINHKTNQGYQVSVITEDQFGSVSGPPPNQVPEKIRKWLSIHYLEQGIKYVLLIGNPDPKVGDIPMKLCWPNRASESYKDCPTDYYYADLTGDWDLDGDGYFGEPENVNFATSPAPSIDPTTFSIKWTGKIKTDTNGIYTFRCYSKEGVKIIIDGVTVINNWAPHDVMVDTGSVNLAQGLHDIEIKYFNITKDACIHLGWRLPNNSNFDTVGPNDLYHLTNGEYADGGLSGTYFDNENFTNSVLDRVDPYICFYWIAGDNGDNGVDFTPEVYVGRIPLYNADYNSAKGILNKIINYENETPIPAWRKKVLLPMKPSDSETPGYDLGENIKNSAAIPFIYDYFRIYEEDYGLDPAPEATPCTIANVVANWKNAYGLVTWWTHGWDTYATSIFTVNNCADLDDSRPSFTYQCSCGNGYPENSNNLGFSLLKHGAISTISATRVSWYAPGIVEPYPSSGINQHLAYYYSKRLMRGMRTGDALYQTKSLSNFWMNNMDFNIYGDPSNALLVALPDLTVVSKHWFISGQQYIIKLTVKNIGISDSGEALIYINAIDPTPPAGENEIRIQLHEDLPPLSRGGEYSFTKSIDLYKIHANEIKDIEVLVDPKDMVHESNESNNQERWTWDEGL